MKITVIIPAHNEEKSIGKVIELVKKNDNVKEIIVVNNLSTDDTEKNAIEAGAKVINCNLQGKGYAMEEGIKKAENEILVFIDGDIVEYETDIITSLANPILNEGKDFVKSNFGREGGRVTELLAKPLLELLFPDIQEFYQPLSGAIAGKKSFFEKIELEKDYGVDIGILLDMIKIGAKVEQVDIGYIKNDSQDWKALTKMSREVANAILKRANKI